MLVFGEPEEAEAAWDAFMARADEIADEWVELVANRPSRVGRLLGLDEFALERLARKRGEFGEAA
jgi:hypothetical protein